MHGQQPDYISFKSGSTSADMGKVLSDGDMPPQPDGSNNLQSPLIERMNLSSGTGPYHLDGVASREDGYSSDPSDPKRKKGTGVAGKSIEEELCRICGDRASGYHYNALSCEGCKGFFRRSITKTANYVCKYGGNCEMDMWMRRKCQSCRLRRCREVGMKEECLLSEDQCKARDARRKSKKPATKKEVVSPDCLESGSKGKACMDVIESVDIKPLIYVSSPSSSSLGSLPGESGCSAVGDNLLMRLEEHHHSVVKLLLGLQEKFEFPDETDVKKATENFNSERNREISSGSFLQTMGEMTVLITHLIVEFAKALPGFTELSKEDQVILLKAASSEVMTLRAARCYDAETRSIVFANGQPCTLENMLATGLGKYAELVYEFCHSMVTMQTDHAEYALMTAISIFSERPGLSNKEEVERLQSRYVDALQAYENAKRTRGGSALAKFLTRLSDLRTISAEHSSLIVDMSNNAAPLPFLVNEVFIQQPEGT